MRGRSPLAMVVLCAAAMWVSGSEARGDNGRCLRAEVPAPIVFPDGSVRPAGTLTLCVADYSPVAAYHRVSVNGMPIGMLFSQRRVAEQMDSDQPVLLFRKTDAGQLRLLGYVWPSGQQAFAYVLQDEPWDARAQRRIPARETPLPPPDGAAAIEAR